MPPKCLFPEQKDIGGDQFRRNLITVPSCDAHNLRKSQDDEFLMASLSSVVGNNSLGFMHTHTKVRRAMDRTSGRLLDAVVHDPREVALHVPGGATFPVLLGRVDMPRLCRALEHVARGMYFHVFRERFIGKCTIMPDFVTYAGSADLEVLKKVARLLVGQEHRGWTCYGENERVFRAKFGPIDEYGLTPMIMSFFGGSHVFVAFQPESVVLPFRTLHEASPENPITIDVHFDFDTA